MESSSEVKRSTHVISVQPNETVLTALPYGPHSSLLEFLKGEPKVLGVSPRPLMGILGKETMLFLQVCLQMKVKTLSRVPLLATPWTAAYQAPPSMGFSRQMYWSGVPLPSPKRGHIQAQIGKQNVWGRGMAAWKCRLGNWLAVPLWASYLTTLYLSFLIY